MADFKSTITADGVLDGKDLTGKTYLVTGANGGIGFETARALTNAGATVVFACRSQEKADAAVVRAGEGRENAVAAALDLASFAHIRDFVGAFDIEKLDGLIANAGVIHADHRETEDGFEMTVGVCHIGHFLLASLLMPKLRAAARLSGDARIVVVASESHRQPAKLDFDRFPLTAESYRFMVAYGQAKLCNILFANAFDRRYREEGIRACSLHPGTMVTTGIARHSAIGRFAMKILTPFTKNPAQGAATSVYCAAYASPEDIGGVYFADCRPKRMTPEAQNPDVAERLWAMSEEWCGPFGV